MRHKLREDESWPTVEQSFGSPISRPVEVTHFLLLGCLDVLVWEFEEFLLADIFVLQFMSNALTLFFQSSHNRRNHYNSAILGQERQELFDEINSWIKVGLQGFLCNSEWRFFLSKVHTKSCICNNIIKPNVVFFESLDEFFDVVGVPQL